MGTWGNIRFSSKRNLESKTFSSLWLVTTHDGFVSDTLMEFLTIPLSIYDRSKLDYEHVWSKFYTDNPTTPDRYWRNNQGFQFYSSFFDESRAEQLDFDTHLSLWNSTPLDITPETMVSFFIWQSVQKWWICPEAEALRYGNGKNGQVPEVWVHEGRLPKVTLTLPLSGESDDDEYEGEYVQSLQKAVQTVAADYPAGYQDVEFILTKKGDSGTITLPIDEIVAGLLWEDLQSQTEGG